MPELATPASCRLNGILPAVRGGPCRGDRRARQADCRHRGPRRGSPSRPTELVGTDPGAVIDPFTGCGGSLVGDRPDGPMDRRKCPVAPPQNCAVDRRPAPAARAVLEERPGTAPCEPTDGEPLGANGGPTALWRFPLAERHHDNATDNHRTTVPEVMAAALMSLAKHGSIWFDLQRTKKGPSGATNSLRSRRRIPTPRPGRTAMCDPVQETGFASHGS